MVEKRIGSLAELLPHPGETLLELLETYGISQIELAKRIGYTPKHINEVCKGNIGITPDMAIRLSTVFNLSSSFWNNLQANYDSEYNELINEQTVTEEELNILKDVPVKELVEYHYLQEINTSNKKSTVLLLRKFFKVSNLSFASDVIDSTVSAYRKGDKEINKIKLAAWIAMCLHDYKPGYDKLDATKLKESIPILKKQILQKDINVAIQNIKSILDKCGITFTVIHHLKGVPVQGYIRNMNDRILMALTIRQKYSDIFWFTFFHELGHLLENKNKKTLNMVDYESSDEFASEKVANEFSANTLINKASFNEFIKKPINPVTISGLAKKEGVTASIVVGRLGHLDSKYYIQYSHLREKYEWA